MVWIQSGQFTPKRIIDICHQEKATEYVNASGGRALYSPDEFLSEGISVSFVETLPHQYKQFDNKFHPFLSIIDVLMFCGSAGTKKIVQKYKLVK